MEPWLKMGQRTVIKRWYNRGLLCSMLKKAMILQRLKVFLTVFLSNEDNCSLKFKFPSISKPSNSCLIHYISFSPILAQTFLCICLDWISYYIYNSNDSITHKLVKEFKYLSLGKSITSCSKLQTSVG